MARSDARTARLAGDREVADKIVNVRLSAGLLERVNALAYLDDTPASAQLRRAVEEYVERRFTSPEMRELLDKKRAEQERELARLQALAGDPDCDGPPLAEPSAQTSAAQTSA